jgi:hypothetical protein
MAGVVRKPSDKKRQTHIGNDADAPSEVWGDEVTTGGEDKHLMQLAEDDSVELSDLLDASDYISDRDAGWSNYDQDTKSFH